MIKVLITGDQSYVGTNVEKWLQQWPDKYMVDTITVKDNSWKTYDFSIYDAVFHVAGIVHLKEKTEMEKLYFTVNRDLALEVAKKAKLSGVRQFIFMSSMSVYGVEGKIGEPVVITKDTPCQPNNFYGKSKYEAEKELQKLEDELFVVAIIRAPMIYGPNCPGNYKRLRELIMKVPLFPRIDNQRSMLFIDNLCECIRLIIDNKSQGLFFPQNREYIDTSELIRLIAKENSKKVILLKNSMIFVKIIGKRISVLNKVFGNLVYDMTISSFADFKYCVTAFDKSIHICEKLRGVNL